MSDGYGERLLSRAKARYPELSFQWRDQVGSTNTVLLDEARSGDGTDRVLIAGSQTKGRGRRGRAWWSDGPGNLHLSVRVTRDVPPRQAGLISLASAVAVIDVLDAGLEIKWPNDLLNEHGRKVGGILCESTPHRTQKTTYIIGIGLNLAVAPELPETASLNLDEAERIRVSIELGRALLDVPRRVTDSAHAVLSDWRRRAHTLGRPVEIGNVRGIAYDVDDTGALILKTPAGTKRILVGDVTMIEHHPEAADDRSDTLF